MSSRLDEIIARSRSRAAPTGRKAEAPRVRQRRKNPLDDVPVTGDIDKDDDADAKGILKALKQSKANADAATDNRYWLALVFVTAEQCNEFIAKAGWGRHADPATGYYDGIGIAAQMGHTLKPAKVKLYGRRRDARLCENVGVLKGE